jgi:aryl-alcohol dehydrogenase-like predicted oxidoreductase
MLYSHIKTNNKISRLGLGTVQFGYDYSFSEKKSQEEVNRILNKCRENGVNFLDTARDYGDSERKIGVYLKESNAKKDFFIATKLTKINSNTTADKEKLKESIFNSVRKSCETLNLQKLDLLQLHQNDSFILNNKHFWNIIGKLKRNDTIKFFGVSVYDVDILKTLIKARGMYIDYIQMPYNIFDRRFKSLFEYIRSYNIEIICRSVFLKGMIPAESKYIPKELEGLLIYKDKLVKIAEKYGFSVFELCILFAISNSEIMTSIIGINTPEELQENINALDKLNMFQDKVLKEIKKIKIKNKFLIDPRRWKSLW